MLKNKKNIFSLYLFIPIFVISIAACKKEDKTVTDNIQSQRDDISNSVHAPIRKNNINKCIKDDKRNECIKNSQEHNMSDLINNKK